jgi:hypothetical protein
MTENKVAPNFNASTLAKTKIEKHKKSKLTYENLNDTHTLIMFDQTPKKSKNNKNVSFKQIDQDCNSIDESKKCSNQ